MSEEHDTRQLLSLYREMLNIRRTEEQLANLMPPG